MLIELFWGRTTHRLELNTSEGRHACETEVRQARQTQCEPENGWHLNVLAVREMDALQIRIVLDQGIDCAVRQLSYTNEANPTKFRQLRRKGKHALVGQLRTASKVQVPDPRALMSKMDDRSVRHIRHMRKVQVL